MDADSSYLSASSVSSVAKSAITCIPTAQRKALGEEPSKGSFDAQRNKSLKNVAHENDEDGYWKWEFMENYGNLLSKIKKVYGNVWEF